MMGMSPASMGLNNSPAAHKPDSYEYSWSWDLAAQAKLNFDPKDAEDGMPWIQGDQGELVFVNAIPSGAHGGWEVKTAPDPSTNDEGSIGLSESTGHTPDPFISNGACSTDYGYTTGRIPAVALTAPNHYASLVFTFLPGYDYGDVKHFHMREPNYCRYITPQYINGFPHLIWDGVAVDHNSIAGGTLSEKSTREGREISSGGMLLESDKGKLITLTYDLRTQLNFTVGGDIKSLWWADSARMGIESIGFIFHGIIIGSTVPNIRSLPIRTQTGGEGRYSMAALGLG